jgi:protein-tyrosine-phosphatase
MDVERMSLEGRVSRYAALADPVRLRIVDLLTVGDVSPLELQGQLGISSSLLAHHLAVLEREGMALRARSEADRRRTYVQLGDAAFDDLLPAPRMAARRVVFVCTGNSARSQLAAALWHEASGIPAASAGTHPAERIEPGAIAAAQRHHLTLAVVRPRRLDEVLQADDFIVTVCDTAHEEMAEPGQVHWSISDPVRDGSDAAFDAAFAEISGRIDKLAPRLTSPL